MGVEVLALHEVDPSLIPGHCNPQGIQELSLRTARCGSRLNKKNPEVSFIQL